MMLVSVFILKGKMRGSQIGGGVMLLCGLVMFFNTSLIEIFTRLTDYIWGVIFGVSAAMVWVVYGMTQKFYCSVWARNKFCFCCTLYVQWRCCRWLSWSCCGSWTAGS